MSAVRLEWQDIPSAVRTRIDALVGSPVQTAVNQAGGFSPGMAARCVLADGREVFIKAVSPDQNPVSPWMQRTEASVSEALPEGFPAPPLLHVLDDGQWVVLVFAVIAGATPVLPWRSSELDQVLRAIERLHDRTDPSPVDGLPTLGERYAEAFSGWRILANADHETAGLDAWSASHLDALAEIESRWVEGCAGTALVHCDIRDDNILIDDREKVWFVDWANSSIGAAWLDVVAFLPAVELRGGPPCEDVWATTTFSQHADPDAVTAAVAAAAGYFTFQSQQPPPPGLPHVRAFQAAQAVPALAWLRRRLDGVGV